MLKNFHVQEKLKCKKSVKRKLIMNIGMIKDRRRRIYLVILKGTGKIEGI